MPRRDRPYHAGRASAAGLGLDVHSSREPAARRTVLRGAPLAPDRDMSRTVVLCVLAACGASHLEEKPGPRGLRADQHLAIASREDDRAAALTQWPESRGARPESANPADQLVTGGVWFGSWDTVSEHHKQAQYHREAAAQLEAEYEQACGDASGESVSVSPLERYGIGGSPVPGGTLVLLSPEAGPPDKLLSAMRCHRAWMMLGRTDMDDCPLDLPGIRVDARGDANGIELTITVADPQLVGELRRRAAHDLEAAQRRRAGAESKEQP